jgi:hypothetical protein
MQSNAATHGMQSRVVRSSSSREEEAALSGGDAAMMAEAL